MALITNRFAAATALAAAVSMSAVPAAAADMSTAPIAHASGGVTAPLAYDADADNAYNHRWRGRRGVDAGDVIAGVLVLGTIAAVASAASRNRTERRYPAGYPGPDYRGPDYRGPDYRYRSDERGSGLDTAVDMCVDQVERGRDRVDGVDSAARTADGWRVDGVLEGGQGFSCLIDNDGRIRDIDIGGYAPAGYAPEYSDRQVEDRQYDDRVYQQARAEQYRAPDIDRGIPQGDSRYDAPDSADQDYGYDAGNYDERSGDERYGDDGRYDMATAPDFEPGN